MKATNRVVFLDYLRVFSMFFIILLHTSAQNWSSSDINGFAWQTFNVYDSLCRWAVPIFVMISGALFIPRKITISEIYKKYILRLVLSLIAWGVFYCLFSNNSISLKNILIGKYHMWFIFMIIGLYMSLPITQEIAKNKNVMRYFLLLAFIFVFLIPSINQIIHDFGRASKTINIINEKIKLIELNMILGYTGYFILGYYINNVYLDKKQRIKIYVLGLLGGLLTIFLQAIVALKTQSHHQNYYGYLTTNVLLLSVAVFVWFKYSNFQQKMPPIIYKLSKYSFGVYLAHVFVLEILKQFGLNTLSFNPVLSTPLIAILVFGISVCISCVMHHIPILKNYIV